MKIVSLVFALSLVPCRVLADVITTGVWSSASTWSVNSDQRPFWAGTSWDGATMGVGFLIGADQDASLEFLHGGFGDPVAFRFDDAAITAAVLYHVTAWQAGRHQFDAGTFSCGSGTGRVSDSWNSYGQYALFRSVGTDTTRYYLGIEDILLSELANDRDYNDCVIAFDVPNNPVPEPSTLVLLLAAAAGGASTRVLRRALRARRERT